jgi:hypothetical protein
MYTHKVTYSFPNNTPATDVDVTISVRDGVDKADAFFIAGNSLSLLLEGGVALPGDPKIVEGEKFNNVFHDILDMLTKHIEDMKRCCNNWDWEELGRAINELEITRDCLRTFLPTPKPESDMTAFDQIDWDAVTEDVLNPKDAEYPVPQLIHDSERIWPPKGDTNA